MLSNEQIEQLHAFCYKHSVRYYDVQVELVDHLANAIEEKMAADPRLSFEDALAQVYKSFGIRGFAPLVAEKQKAVNRQSRKLLWSLFRQQLRWPKAMAALAVFALSYSLLQLPSETWFIVAALGSLLIITTIMVVAGYRLQRMEKRSGRQFLLLQFRHMLGIAFIPLNLINVLNLVRPEHESMLASMGTAGQLLVSSLFTFFVVMAVATCQAFKHMETVLLKNYPAVFNTAK